MPPTKTLALVETLQKRIHGCLKEFVPQDEHLAILDFPDIRNCGDSAIWIGELAYLANQHGKRPSYVARIRDFSPERLKLAAPNGPIFIHGGGNFGDVWMGHQKFRERVLASFPDRQVIQFPQSIHYQSQKRLIESARVISHHKDFVLLVRDEESKQVAESTFDCQVRLCPDMAFCIGPLKPSAPEFPVLVMLRDDKESLRHAEGLLSTSDMQVEDWITESSIKVKISKLLGAATGLPHLNADEIRFRMLNAAAQNRLRRGTRQLSRGHTIVTDRLHVHILSLLLGRPHAVLDNNYGKIRRFMSAFTRECDLSFQASSLSDGISWARNNALQ